MRIRRGIQACALLLALTMLLGGCAASLKTARVASKFGTALKEQPVTSATAEVSCSVTASNGEEQGSARFRTVVHSKINWEESRSYSDIYANFNINGTEIPYTMQCYENAESGDSVRYLHMNEQELWLRLDLQKPLVSIDPALIMLLMDTVAESTELEARENPNTGNVHYILRLCFSAENIREFIDNAGIRLPEELRSCDLGGVQVPVELEIEDKTYLPIRVQIQLQGINSSLIHGIASAFAKAKDVEGLDVQMDTISVLITNFGYDTYDIPMLPMGAAENALDMSKVREIRNGK